MILTKSFKLYTNKTYQNRFDKQINIVRFCYNLAKETKETCYKYGLNLSNFDLQKQLTECKKENNWMYGVGADTIIDALDRLDLAYQSYFRSLKDGTVLKLKSKYLAKQQKNNQPINWNKYHSFCKPKWAKKKEYNSLGFKILKATGDGFNLPKFGKVKVHNFKYYKGEKLKTAILIKKVDGLYLQVVMEVDRVLKPNENQVGIDMGIKHFLTSSNGDFIENPQFLKNSLPKLRVEQRRMSRMLDFHKKSKRKEYGYNLNKQIQKVKKMHQSITNKRLDFLHKVSTDLANNYGLVFREDLNIKGMVKSKLSRHISDASWGKFFELLEYKTNVVKVNPAYTSQTCNKCGYISKENRKTQSIFKCVKCNHFDNADLNASFNIIKQGHLLMDAKIGQLSSSLVQESRLL
jgi:putative transposase